MEVFGRWRWGGGSSVNLTLELLVCKNPEWHLEHAAMHCSGEIDVRVCSPHLYVYIVVHKSAGLPTTVAAAL